MSFRSSFYDWKMEWWHYGITYLVFGAITWAVLSPLVAGRWGLLDLVGIEILSLVAWICVNARRWNREALEADRKERKYQEEREAAEYEQKRLDMFRANLAKRTSDAFARQFNYGQIDYFILNPCEDLRSLSAAMWDRHQFIPEDKPSCHIVRLMWLDGHGDHKYYFLVSANWYIKGKIDQEQIFLADKSAGRKLLVDILPEDDEETRLRQILHYASNYSSVSDRTLSSIVSWAVPMLKGMKSACPTPKLAALRIALQLREKAEELSISNIDELLEYDPDK